VKAFMIPPPTLTLSRDQAQAQNLCQLTASPIIISFALALYVRLLSIRSASQFWPRRRIASSLLTLAISESKSIGMMLFLRFCSPGWPASRVRLYPKRVLREKADGRERGLRSGTRLLPTLYGRAALDSAVSSSDTFVPDLLLPISSLSQRVRLISTHAKPDGRRSLKP
jgi:hypothetical protein